MTQRYNKVSLVVNAWRFSRDVNEIQARFFFLSFFFHLLSPRLEESVSTELYLSRCEIELKEYRLIYVWR